MHSELVLNRGKIKSKSLEIGVTYRNSDASFVFVFTERVEGRQDFNAFVLKNDNGSISPGSLTLVAGDYYVFEDSILVNNNDKY